MYTKSQNIHDICQERELQLSQLRRVKREQNLNQNRNINEFNTNKIIYDLKKQQTLSYLIIGFNRETYTHVELKYIHNVSYEDLISKLNLNI